MNSTGNEQGSQQLTPEKTIILIAEDEAVIRNLVQLMLVKKGYAVDPGMTMFLVVRAEESPAEARLSWMQPKRSGNSGGISWSNRFSERIVVEGVGPAVGGPGHSRFGPRFRRQPVPPARRRSGTLEDK
jgi:hypothetical protein